MHLLFYINCVFCQDNNDFFVNVPKHTDVSIIGGSIEVASTENRPNKTYFQIIMLSHIVYLTLTAYIKNDDYSHVHALLKSTCDNKLRLSSGKL